MWVGVAEGVVVGVPDGVADGVWVGLAEGDAVGVAEGLADGVPLGVPDGVLVGVPEGVAEGEAVGVPEGVAAGPSSTGSAHKPNIPTPSRSNLWQKNQKNSPYLDGTGSPSRRDRAHIEHHQSVLNPNTFQMQGRRLSLLSLLH